MGGAWNHDEPQADAQRDDRFWLYVVECASSEPRLWCIRNPAWLATSYTFADDWADARYAEGPFSLP